MQTISKQSGVGFILKRGEYLKVSGPKGQQVSDMVLFNKNDKRKKYQAEKP